MFPTSVTIFEEEGSCGPPLLRVIAQQESDDPNEQELIDLCEDQSADRLVVAGLLALGGVVVGGGLLIADRGRSGASADPPPMAPPAPLRGRRRGVGQVSS